MALPSCHGCVKKEASQPFGSGFPLQSFAEKAKGFPLQSLTRVHDYEP
ncbi:hypothetical protein [Pseudotamlana haliotis]|nr:hypothetical protein [Tamlana haliotis]